MGSMFQVISPVAPVFVWRQGETVTPPAGPGTAVPRRRFEIYGQAGVFVWGLRRGTAAGNVYSVSVNESVSAADATAGARLASGGVSESVSVAETLAALAALGRTVAEAVTVTELLSGTRAAVVAVAEAVSLSEQQATGPVVTGAMAEAVSAADALQAAASLVAQIAAAASAGDTLTTARQMLALRTEAITATDGVAASAPAAYSVSVTELATALDQIVAALASDPVFASAVFRIARGTSTTRAVKGTARQPIRGYQ